MKRVIWILLTVLSCSVMSVDLEIYVGGNNNFEPNVMLILDDSGSMAYSMDGTEFRNDKNELILTSESRWSITVPIIINIINKLQNVRVGLALFNKTVKEGRKSRIFVPIGPLDEPSLGKPELTTRQHIINVLNQGLFGGGTPLSVSLEDVYRYLVGKERKRIEFSKEDVKKFKNTESTDFFGFTDDVLSDAYPSPIIHECQNTQVTLFTDGRPSGLVFLNDSARKNIFSKNRFVGANLQQVITLPGTNSRRVFNVQLNQNCSPFSSVCLDEIAYHMSQVMHQPNFAQLGETFNLPRRQTKLLNEFNAENPNASHGVIRVNTIGAGEEETFFNANGSATSAGLLLIKTAIAGRGEFFLATSEQELEEALSSTLESVSVANQSLIPPVISATSFNPLALDDFAYVPIFEPSTEGTINWQGNLKKYRFEVKDSIRQLVGKNGTNLYQQTANGVSFNVNATDEWSSETGTAGEVAKGGVRESLSTNKQRTIVTVLPDPTTGVVQYKPMLRLTRPEVEAEVIKRIQAGIEVGISDQKTIVRPDATFSSQGFIDLRRWIFSGGNGATGTLNGTDVFGAPIHGSPIPIVTKRGTSSTSNDEKRIIVVGTDRGILHFFDADTGEERLAFIPPEMFPGLNVYRRGSAGIKGKPMGMDGFIEVISDVRSGGDRVTVVVGARRGANVYYVLDLKIDANGELSRRVLQHRVTILNDKLSPLYGQFGQSWPRPILNRVKVNPLDDSEDGMVVGLFAGGYDPRQDQYVGATADDVPLRDEDTVGQFITLVNLNRPNSSSYGKPIWAAMSRDLEDSLSLGSQVRVTTDRLRDMKNSFPSEAVWVDMDGDGLREKFFVVDIQGRIFRFDLDQAAAIAAGGNNPTRNMLRNIKGGLVADLTRRGGNTPLNRKQRAIRFYERPSVFRGTVPLRANTDSDLEATGTRQVIKMALGSGYRAHPLVLADDQFSADPYHLQDRFYILALDNVDSIPVKYESFNERRLENVTNDGLGYWSLNDDRKKRYDADISNKLAIQDNSGNERTINQRTFGIYVDLFTAIGGQARNDGEKVFSPPTTAAGQVLFTTYVPPDETSNRCELNLGNSFLYAMDANNWRVDPFWRIGSSPDDTAGDGDKVSSDFNVDQGRYPLPFPGFGASAAHTGPAFGDEGGGYSTGSVGGIQIHRHDQPDENTASKALKRLYWQELSE